MRVVTVDKVNVPHWGSAWGARRVSESRHRMKELRELIATNGTVYADTDKGTRRLVIRGGRIYTRMPI